MTNDAVDQHGHAVGYSNAEDDGRLGPGTGRAPGNGRGLPDAAARDKQSKRLPDRDTRDRHRPFARSMVVVRAAVLESEPSAILTEALMPLLFRNAPYARPLIGWRHEMEKLDGALAYE